MKPRVLLCWEAGFGRGHVTKLAMLAKALAGHAELHARLIRVDQAAPLAPYCASLSRGMALRRKPPPDIGDRQRPNIKRSWASWLAVRGFDDPEILRKHFEWWRDTIWAVRPALVICDFAPTALLAARALNVPTVATGIAYGFPPADMSRYPPLSPDSPGQDFDEDALRDVINTTLGPLGLPPLHHLPEVYRADLALPSGLDLCDPYHGWRKDPLILPFEKLPALSEQQGDELFVYFSSKELQEPAILEAMQTLNIPTALVALNLSDDVRAALVRNPMLQILTSPLPRDEIARRARMVVCSGQGGTSATAILAGLPCLALPTDQEKASNARGISRLASCRHISKAERSAPRILNMIQQMWDTPALADHARTDALRLRAHYPADTVGHLKQRVMPLIRPIPEFRFPGL